MKAEWKKFDSKNESEPAQGKAVLVTDVNGVVGIGTRMNAAGFVTSGCLSSVVAWAPLPEAFQEKAKV